MSLLYSLYTRFCFDQDSDHHISYAGYTGYRTRPISQICSETLCFTGIRPIYITLNFWYGSDKIGRRTIANREQCCAAKREDNVVLTTA